VGSMASSSDSFPAEVGNVDTTSGNASDPENSADDIELTDGEHPTSKDHELATDLHKMDTTDD
ncbi:transcription antitermination factor NusB, partial [Salmonella enterica subsp. enterica serovar Derby]